MSSTVLRNLRVQPFCSTIAAMMAVGSKLPPTHKIPVGERLMLLRMTKGWKQNTFARLIGIEPQRLWNWEHGLHAIPNEYLGKVCSLTGANPNYVLWGDKGHLSPVLIESLAEQEKNLASEKGKRRAVRRT